MNIRNLNDVNALIEALDKCTGEVWLENMNGEKYTLTKKLDRAIAITQLYAGGGQDLELFTSNRADEQILMGYFLEDEARLA